jgi:hypothetical protein
MAQGQLPLDYPRLDMNKPVIASRENRAELDRRHSTNTQTLPVAVGWKMGSM